MANLVHRRGVIDLVTELKARKTIAKEQVVKESVWLGSFLPWSATYFFASDEQSRWCWYRNHV